MWEWITLFHPIRRFIFPCSFAGQALDQRFRRLSGNSMIPNHADDYTRIFTNSGIK
jgi:hypothetical protein